MTLLRKILCAVLGHDYWLCANQWRCHRCDKWERASYDHPDKCAMCRVLGKHGDHL